MPLTFCPGASTVGRVVGDVLGVDIGGSVSEFTDLVVVGAVTDGDLDGAECTVERFDGLIVGATVGSEVDRPTVDDTGDLVGLMVGDRG